MDIRVAQNGFDGETAYLPFAPGSPLDAGIHSRVYSSREEVGPLAFPFLHELANTPAVRRLENIGFLGAIEFLQYGNGNEPHRHRHNRYDHSVGVAKLAFAFARVRELDEATTKTLVAAALLHDVGHGPLSHTLEPIFQETFGFGHHSVGDAIIRGIGPLGREVYSTLRAHGVDSAEVAALLAGNSAHEYAFLFSGPMNLDTFEGITRSRYFATSWSASPPASLMVRALATETPTHALLDAFWELKDAVYRVLIHSRTGLIMDSVAQAYMRQRLAQFHPSDFYRDERQLRRKHPALFSLLSSARSIYSFVSSLPEKLLEQTISMKERRFFIDRRALPSAWQDLGNRYKQSKSGQELSLADLVTPRLNLQMRYQRNAQMELLDGEAGYAAKSKRAV